MARKDGFNLTNLQRCCQINAADRIDFKSCCGYNNTVDVEEALQQPQSRAGMELSGWRRWHGIDTQRHLMRSVVLLLRLLLNLRAAGALDWMGVCAGWRRTTTSGLMVIICRRLSRIDVDNGISIRTIIRTIVDCVHKFKIYYVHGPNI